MDSKNVTVRVWGNFACFTRPEMKVERVSYPVMTPSAARGVLEAIFWEPEIYYLVDSISVVRRGQWFPFRRNEMTENIKLSKVKQWMREPEKTEPLMAGAGSKLCAPRNMLALYDVEYLITSELHLTGRGKIGKHNWQTYYDEIKRRIQHGKCFHRPYLGVREFAADFDWEQDAESALQRRAAELVCESGTEWQAYDDDLGLMLYDVFDDQKRTDGTTVAPGATFFKGKVVNSVLDCHPQRVEILRKEGP